MIAGYIDADVIVVGEVTFELILIPLMRLMFHK
jgi:hypothetical protein